MRIFADQNIPFAQHAFAHIGDVTTFVGRELKAKDVQDADILLVRSVTKVDQALLSYSSVKFVGSATIGTDHVDLDYLLHHNITFANAPGSNATSAAEYVLAGFLEYVMQHDVDTTGLQVGIVGYGNVGSRVANLFGALNIQCHIYDPPRQQQLNDVDYCDWQTICNCDVVTAHVPLTKDGNYPTYLMFDDDFFRKLKPGALFINTARGFAVDERALLARLARHQQIDLILDVWQNEPSINPHLLEQTLISTPHVAGYAYDGKLRGTEMIYQAVCERFDINPQWTAEQVLTEATVKLTAENTGKGWAWLHDLVQQAYDIVHDSNQLRKILTMDSDDAATHFDALRKNYPQRREFSHFTVDTSGLLEHQQYVIQQLGFMIYR